MEALKPCRNCGNTTPEVEGLRPSDLVFCDCGEESSLEEWQASTAREAALQERIDALLELVKAQGKLANAVKLEARAAKRQENTEGMLKNEWFKLRHQDAKKRLAKAKSAVESSRAKCRALGLEV